MKSQTYHYTYKVTSESGKFYIGRHSSKLLNDNYMGSGKWVRSLKDKSSLKKEIISFYNTFDDLLKAEEQLIKSNIDNPLCMNYNNLPVGFASGDRHPNRHPNKKKILSERMLGEKNPSKRPEVREKMSKSQKGRPAKNKGIPHKEQTKKLIGKGNSKAVEQLSINGTVINTYKSLTKASEKTGISISWISTACSKGTTAGGFLWRKSK